MDRCCLPRLWGLLRPHRRGGERIVLAEALEGRITPSFTVMNAGDTGAGTLRQAIIDANNSPGADTIVFDSAFFSTPRTIMINSAPPQIGGPLTIIGPGASLLTVQRGAGGLENTRRPFDSVATSLSISGMTITGGNVTGANGGGLQAAGVTPNITLDSVVLTNNNTNGLGGAIYMGNGGTLTIRNSVVSGNTAANGGGIYFFSNGSLVMENCTISGNAANLAGMGAGGGLFFSGIATAAPPTGFTAGTLLIRNSTFSGNMSTAVGGAIAVDTFTGTLQVQNSTISGNTAAISGGAISGAGGSGAITLQDSTITSNTANGTTAGTGGGGVARSSTLNNAVTIVNSIVSGNSNANAPDIRTDSFTTTHVNSSAIGSTSGFTLASGSGNNLPVGANLMLAPLASNGGTTQTHAIQPGSPLIDAGSNASVPAALTTDQRGPGFARINGSAVDIGSFESTVALTFVSAQFLYLTSPHSVQFTFNENILAAPELADLILNNLTTHAVVSYAQLQVTLQQNLLTVTYPAGVLPDGNYVATVPAGSLADSTGNMLASDVNFPFFVLSGDADHDRHVDTQDFNALAMHFNQTGVNFGQGDFNYSGKVNALDFNVLAVNFGRNLAAQPGSAASPLAIVAVKDLFARARISAEANRFDDEGVV